VYYIRIMKTLTVRLPEQLAAEIAAESKVRRISKSDVIRERLHNAKPASQLPPTLDDIADLMGSVVDDLPSDLSARKKEYLKKWGYGRNRRR
jgi:Arc/MetJ-type ribon-helix-helix transcriptional regulator